MVSSKLDPLLNALFNSSDNNYANWKVNEMREMPFLLNCTNNTVAPWKAD